MSHYTNLNGKLDSLERLKKDLVDALIAAGVPNVSYSTSFHDLPDKVLSLCGEDVTAWRNSLNREFAKIGYTQRDAYIASYRFLEHCVNNIVGYNYIRYYSPELSSDCYTLAKAEAYIKDEIGKSIDKTLEWARTINTYAFFSNWDGFFLPYINTSGVTNFNNFMAGASNLTYIPLLDTSHVTTATHAFDRVNVREFPEFDFGACGNFDTFGTFNQLYIFPIKNIGNTPISNAYYLLGGVGRAYEHDSFMWAKPCNGAILKYPIALTGNPAFGNSAKIASIISMEGISNYTQDFSVRSSTKLSHNSARNLIDSLPETSGANLTFHDNVYAKLTNSDIAVAENKGWTVLHSNKTGAGD